MLRNITLSAEAGLIEKAREKAKRNRKSLNEAFREWLRRYAGLSIAPEEYRRLMKALSYARPGRKFGRDEMNER